MAALLPLRSAPVQPLMFQIRALASSVRFFGLMKIWTLGDVFPSATGKAYLVPHRTACEKDPRSRSFPCRWEQRSSCLNEAVREAERAACGRRPSNDVAFAEQDRQANT